LFSIKAFHLLNPETGDFLAPRNPIPFVAGPAASFHATSREPPLPVELALPVEAALPEDILLLVAKAVAALPDETARSLGKVDETSLLAVVSISEAAAFSFSGS